MKIGIQSIGWGGRVRKLEDMLDYVSALGYEGIEIAQRYERLGSIDRLEKLLKERELSFIGMTSGTLEERVNFCKEFPPEYYYIENMKYEMFLNKNIDVTSLPLALHMHSYKVVNRFEDVELQLNEYPELKFILDIAHVLIGGEDPISIIEQFHKKMASIHFKDWNSTAGRSVHRYARGITELGTGDAPLNDIIATLKKVDYDGWLIVEKDSPSQNPEDSILENSRWLAERGLLEIKSQALNKVERRYINMPSSGVNKTNDYNLNLLNVIIKNKPKNMKDCYQTIAQAFLGLEFCELVTIWAWNSRQDTMTYITSSPDVEHDKYLLSREEALSSSVVDYVKPMTANLKEIDSYPNKSALEKFNFGQMISIPVFNVNNYNHVRLIINMFVSDKMPTNITDRDLLLLGRQVSYAVDYAINEFCVHAAAETSTLAAECLNESEFLTGLRKLILDNLGCEAVSIFLKDVITGDKLYLESSTGIDWQVPKKDQFYTIDEGLTGRAWRRRDTYILEDTWENHSIAKKSYDRIQKGKDFSLIAPLVDSKGEVSGVVRCHNKLSAPAEKHNMFSYDDATVLETICQAALPHLQVLRSQSMHTKALSRVTHEFAAPLSAILSALDLINRELNHKNIRFTELVRYNFLGDIESWCNIMQKQIGNSDFFRYMTEGIQLSPSYILLMSDVIAPVVNQIDILLRQRRFRKLSIEYQNNFEEIPRLWIDRQRFQQVFFNLLSNSIKYCFNDPNAFQVEIAGFRSYSEYIITFKDWGPGIPNGMKEGIFEAGVRGPEAIASDVSGQGIGLSVVRQIVEAHGGKVLLTSEGQPTEFSISLPRALASKRPEAI